MVGRGRRNFHGKPACFIARNELKPTEREEKFMANYIIIGGDGKEYGPVTDTDVRQWIAEGRLASSSLAKGEGDAEFRALSKFPELAASFAPANLGLASAPPPLEPSPKVNLGQNANAARQTALQDIKVPSICLKVVAVLNFILAFWNLMKLIFVPSAIDALLEEHPQLKDPEVMKMLHLAFGPLGMAEAVFGMVISGLIFFGAMKMQSLSSYSFAFVAAVLAMVPCMTPCCVIGLPFGIWALVVLNKPGIKSQFD
jgi:hypothetical protein